MLRRTAAAGMPIRFASTWHSKVLSATSESAVTVNDDRFVTSSTPLRSRMRPRGAFFVMVRVRFVSACLLYSSEETSCMDQRRAISTPITPTAAIPRPVRRSLNPVSAEVSLPPSARGAAPPISKVKRPSPRPNTMNMTTSATARTPTTATMSRVRFISAPTAYPRYSARRRACRHASCSDPYRSHGR